MKSNLPPSFFTDHGVLLFAILPLNASNILLEPKLSDWSLFVLLVTLPPIQGVSLSFVTITVLILPVGCIPTISVILPLKPFTEYPCPAIPTIFLFFRAIKNVTSLPFLATKVTFSFTG